MIKVLGVSLQFMSLNERARWSVLLASRIIINVLDVAAILAVGFVATSTAFFLTGGSDPNRELQFAGLQLPAVTAQTLPFVASGILVAFILKALTSIWLTRLTSELVARVEARAAKAVAETVFQGDLSTARGKSREELMFAIQVGSPSSFNGLLNGLAAIISEGTLFLLVCLGFSLVSLEITVAAILYFGVVGWVINFYIGTKLSIEAERANTSAVDANAAVGDLVSVFRELSVQGKVDFFIDRLYNSRLSAAGSTAKQFYLTSMPRYIIESALLVGIAMFVLSQAISGNIVDSLSSIGVFLAGGFRLTAAMLPLQTALLSVKAAIPAAKSVTALLSKSLAVREPKNLRKPADLLENNVGKETGTQSGALGVHASALVYAYPGAINPSINGASFSIEPGSQIAFIGPSGSGKSTLADLICGLLIPTAGSIKLISQKPLGENRVASVAYVPQHPGFVSGTILDNIALGFPSQEVDIERAMHALSGAHLDQVVRELPLGLGTNLGKLKDGLSGGEIQRLGLARALYARPGILVMDEATSALDAESESEIQKALDEMRGRVTVILIAHRLNTIQHADKVFLVEDGQVKDSGTFKDLMSRNSSLERIVDLMRIEKD
jgi:ABC-type multidrug transport system fused ATPase/permease subunit